METDSSLQERYVCAMVLSGVGDALGYKNGEWEFCHSGSIIHSELEKLGGLENIVVRLPKWSVSDDTVMHVATGEAMVKAGMNSDREKLFSLIAEAYKASMKDMSGRAPGMTCMNGTHMLKPRFKDGYKIPFNKRGGGCGAAMRSMCIGLRYPRPEELDDLIAVSVESGRMTHHHPTGYLGSFAGALFTSYAIQGKPVCSWGKSLLDTLPQVLAYVSSTKHCAAENKEHWGYFSEKWEAYLHLRGLSDGKSQPVFPEKFGFAERDKFVKSVSFSGWGGSSGHDAPMIAYDALLAAGNNWHELCNRAMFHAGDSDSTGVMAACWYGALYGMEHVPVFNYKVVEYKNRLKKVGASLYALAFPSGAQSEGNPVALSDDDVIEEVDEEAMDAQILQEGNDEAVHEQSSEQTRNANESGPMETQSGISDAQGDCSNQTKDADNVNEQKDDVDTQNHTDTTGGMVDNVEKNETDTSAGMVDNVEKNETDTSAGMVDNVEKNETDTSGRMVDNVEKNETDTSGGMVDNVEKNETDVSVDVHENNDIKKDSGKCDEPQDKVESMTGDFQ